MEQVKSCFTTQSANNECADQTDHLRRLINTFFYYGISRIYFLMARPSAVCNLFFSFSICIGVAPITQYTHVRNKNSNTQGSSPNEVRVIFPYLKELLLKQWIRSFWEQLLSFKRSSQFKKGRNCREIIV